jgi:hypothetical protein
MVLLNLEERAVEPEEDEELYSEDDLVDHLMRMGLEWLVIVCRVEGRSFLTIFMINLSFPSFNVVMICFQDGLRAKMTFPGGTSRDCR